MSLCTVVAVFSYLAVHSESLLVHADGLPLTREQFVIKVKRALQAAQIDFTLYSGHSFRIGAASAEAAAAGVPGLFYQDVGQVGK